MFPFITSTREHLLPTTRVEEPKPPTKPYTGGAYVIHRNEEGTPCFKFFRDTEISEAKSHMSDLTKRGIRHTLRFVNPQKVA